MVESRGLKPAEDSGSRSHGHSVVRMLVRGLGYLGAAVTAVGVAETASVLFFDVWLNQSACQDGLSPQPARGCGYVPELVLFNWGPNNGYPELVSGIYLIYAGLTILVVRWLIQFYTKGDSGRIGNAPLTEPSKLN